MLEDQGAFGGDEEAEMSFGVDENGVPLEPFAEALVAVGRDHFTFLSAESAADPQAGVANMEERMGKMEAGLEKLLKVVTGLQVPPGPPPPHGGPAPNGGARNVGATAKAPPTGAGGMDPMLMQQALASGLDPATVAEFGKLLQPPGLGRKSALRTPAPAPTTLQTAETSDSSDEEDEEEGGEDSGSAAPLQKAVVHLSKIVKDMRKEKKSRKSKGLEALLDGAEGSGSQRDVGGSSRGKAAALRTLQQTLTSNPELIYEAIERQLQADWERSGSAPGLGVSLVSARGWVEHRSKIQNYASSVRPAWLMAGIWDCLLHGKTAEARARAALAVAVMDQQGCDRGGWLLASEATLENPPPFSAFSQHTPPEPWELQHSQLLDPRWVELFLAKLRRKPNLVEKASGPKSPAAETPRTIQQQRAGARPARKARRRGPRTPHPQHLRIHEHYDCCS